jgi:signal transduction histidine kinase
MRFRLWPKSLIGQLVFAVAVMLFVAQAVNFALLARGMKQQMLAHGGGMTVARIIDAVDRYERGLIEPQRARGDPRERRRQRREPRVWTGDAAPPVPPGASAMPELADYVATLLGDANVDARNVKAWVLPQRPRFGRTELPGRTAIVVAEVGGRYYAVRGRLPASGNRLQGFLVWQTLVLYLLLLIPIMIIAWRAAAPLRDLTRAARSNPAVRDATPIDEEGPSDVRDLIRAFNAYRARISTMLADKDRMLGAVGHDLRTPLASLRVRVEGVEDDRLRDKMIASIDEMTAMLTDILALARTGAGNEVQERIELSALVRELAEDYVEQGKNVAVDNVVQSAVVARPMLLRRALRNLIDNGVTYGSRARLSVRLVADQAQVVVADDGPGLTDEQIRTLVEPFARGEQSRNRATGGAGLGLSIAREIAAGEGGALSLANGAQGGLEAVIALPIA